MVAEGFRTGSVALSDRMDLLVFARMDSFAPAQMDLMVPAQMDS
ncbi:hypothetical protein VCRA2120O332_20732 [Vibrio crassostreae]|nr:hypothetical protein VCRA2114E327_70193 [Vibrio crassostreae]CAK3533188.1 hypothetical protein VCRA2120O332_20732 [Vibrio crassostreae]